MKGIKHALHFYIDNNKKIHNRHKPENFSNCYRYMYIAVHVQGMYI